MLYIGDHEMDEEEVKLAEELLKTVGRRVTNTVPIYIFGYETFRITTVSEIEGQEGDPIDFVLLSEVQQYVEEQKRLRR